MGLDLYAGTLTRYYTHDWKTAVQAWAEANGYAFRRITPEGDPIAEEESLSPGEVQAAMEAWRDGILAALAQPDRAPHAPWPEDRETPYYTDKPDWDAFGALLLTAACHVYGEPVPPTVQKDWAFQAHPLIHRLAEDGEHVWSLARGAVWWLPLPGSFLFQGPLPTGDQAVIATLGGLRKELETLNALAWRAGEEDILRWSGTEGYPVEGEMGPGGVFTREDLPADTRYDTRSLAKFAFSLFYQALRFAEEHRVPILLDF